MEKNTLNQEVEMKRIQVPVMADLFAQGKKTEFLFWVGDAGAFDDRFKKVTRAFVKILTYLNIDYAVLGNEESSSADSARRAGNEMLFQMQALNNIEILNNYGVKKIITCDPHEYNTLKNEYPDFGGHYEVYHHTQFLRDLIRKGKLQLDKNVFANKKLLFHDPCYLGRANGEYKAPRQIIDALSNKRLEMKRNKSFALCCGAGGGQMFKEAEKGQKEVFIERIEEALACSPDIIVTACPFCMVMLSDGLKYKNKEEDIFVYDPAELIAQVLEL
jgi:heterodisulfide reductase subunit D